MKSCLPYTLLLLGLLSNSNVFAEQCRDRRKWPFSISSIWNTPIGSDANYMAANLYIGNDCDAGTDLNERVLCPGWNRSITPIQCVDVLDCCYEPTPDPNPENIPWCFKTKTSPGQIHADQDYFVTASGTDPLTPWYDQGSWDGSDHCELKNDSIFVRSIHVPNNFLCPNKYGPENNAVGILMPDNITLLETQPVYRCSPGAPFLSRTNASCCPNGYPQYQSILGDGALGAHGGSGLSATGGMIRVGELLNTTGQIRHALKLEFFAHQYYYGGHQLQPHTETNGGRTQYVWPAIGSDAYTWNTGSRLAYNGTNPYLVPGALLAIPPTLANKVQTTTVPGAKIKDALLQFGGYIVDDTASDSAAICCEGDASIEFEQVYGERFSTNSGPWYDDLLTIFRALHIVVNNGPHAIGGGGHPSTYLAPPICDE